jgi:hypothetical protein
MIGVMRQQRYGTLFGFDDNRPLSYQQLIVKMHNYLMYNEKGATKIVRRSIVILA